MHYFHYKADEIHASARAAGALKFKMGGLFAINLGARQIASNSFLMCFVPIENKLTGAVQVKY